MVEESGKERAALAAAAGAQVEAARCEADALRRLVKLKTRELKHVRRLAQEVGGGGRGATGVLRQVRHAGERGGMNRANVAMGSRARVPGNRWGPGGCASVTAACRSSPLPLQVLLQRSDVEIFLLSSLHQVGSSTAAPGT